MRSFCTLLIFPLVSSTERFNDEVCISDFQGCSGEPCLEYGFCSSCVLNGYSWCEATNRCVESYHECGINDRLSSLDECNNMYQNEYIENPIVFTTDYSAKTAEKMAIYAEYAYFKEELKPFSQWETFDLSEIKMFEEMVTNIGSNTIQLFSQIAEGYHLLSAIIPDYNGPKYESPLYDKKELTDFVNSLDAGTPYDLPFAHNLVPLLDEQLVIHLPESNILGPQKAVIGIDHGIKGIVISFRGTTTANNDATMRGNVLFSRSINWDKSDVSELLKVHQIDLSVKVHAYFLDGLDTLKNSKDDNGISFFEYVMEYIEEYESYDIYITGHSLGGALANLFSLDLYAFYYNNEALPSLDSSKFNIYTFGQPRVGNDGFALLLNAIFDYRYYRIVNSNDIVCSNPPWILGFRHNGIEIHYAEGDYQNNKMCQYRECINLDPFEDPSCRSRYDDIFFGQDVIELTGQILHGLEYVKKIISGEDTEGIEQPVGPLANMVKLYLDETFGVEDHISYERLGQYGHCAVLDDHSTSVDHVKCEDHTSSSSVNTDSYKCINLLSGIGNVVESIDTKYTQIFHKLNGCYGAGDDMLCCMGGPHGPLTVCKEKDNWMDFMCPANDVGQYCIISKDCIDEAMCYDGICVLYDDVDIDHIVIMYIEKGHEIRYWLYTLFGIKIDLISDLSQLLDELFQELMSKSDVLKEKIEEYAGKIELIKQWTQQILDVDIDSLDEICEYIQKWIQKISNGAIDDKIGNKICVDLSEKLKNIIGAIQKFGIVYNLDESQKEKSILMIDFKDKNLWIYGLLALNVLSTISFMVYCYIQHKRKEYRYQSVQPCSTDDEK